MIQSLRKKFILINMLLVSMVLLLGFSALCIGSHKRMERDSVRVLEMALKRQDDQRSPIFEIGQDPPPDFLRDPVFVVHINQNGRILLSGSDNISISEERLGQIAAKAQEAGRERGFLREYNLLYLKKQENGALRIAFIDLSGNATTLRNIILSCVFLLAATLAAFFVISLFLSKWALRPVEEAWRRQRQFVADASHELKTPLTIILANMGILKSNRADTVARQIDWVENTEVEAGRMKKLVDSLLFLAKADEAKAPMICGKVNFSDAIFGAALAFESVAYERGVAIDTDHISPDVYVLGDEAQLSQLAGILLDNAVKYSEDGAIVTLSLARRQDTAVLSVHNTGSHLEAEDLEHVFDRFYRADKSRSNAGYGLGLSIAKSIADSHHGKISADSNAEKGTIFTVAMPLYE